MRYLKSATFLFLSISGSFSMLSQAVAATTETSANSLSENAEPEISTLSESTATANLASSDRFSSPLQSVEDAVTVLASADLVSILDGAQGERQATLLDAVLARRQPNQVTPRVTEARSPVFSRASLTDEPAILAEGSAVKNVLDKLLLLAQSEPSEDLPTLESAEPQDDAELPAAVEPATAEGSDGPGTEPEPTPEPVTETPPAPDEEATEAPPAEGEGAGDDVEVPQLSVPGDAAPDEPAPSDVDANDAVAPPAVESGGLPDSLISDPNPLSTPTAVEEIDIERNPLVTLEQAIDLAYRNNQALQSALLTLEQSEAAVDAARAARRPNVVTQATLANTQTGVLADDNTAGDGSNTQLGGSVELNYNLLTGGGREASIRAAEIQRNISSLAVEAQQEQLRLATSTAYYALQDAGEQIRINQAFLNEAERNLNDARLRQDVGVGTRFDTLRAEVQFANAQQQVVQAEGNQQIARRDISRLLNLPPNAGLETTPVKVADTWPLTLEESILMAFQNRAELEQQILQSDLSEQQRRVALSAIRPQVSLFARYSPTFDLDGSDVDNPFAADPDDFTDNIQLGANFSWTLYDGGNARAQARQQEIAGEIAETTFSETQDQIRFDVEQAYANLTTSQKNIATSQVAVAQASEALQLANLRLQAGVGTQLDVLTAQSELTQAEANNVAAILGYNRALVSLERAISNVSDGL